MKRILLLSGGKLSWYSDEVKDFLKDVKKVLFIPYAKHDLENYEDLVANQWLNPLGFECKSIHRFEDPRKAIEEAQAIFVGGGNTFRLLNKMYELDLIDLIRKRVEKGMSYLGSSAGSNMACPSIMTTNDMPIVQPPLFKAFNLIPFQINPHYLDPDPSSKHMGETREKRISQFHEMNETPVLGIREQSMVRVEGDKCKLIGPHGARLFRKGEEPIDYDHGTDLSFLL